jgi:hypothetical protein
VGFLNHAIGGDRYTEAVNDLKELHSVVHERVRAKAGVAKTIIADLDSL